MAKIINDEGFPVLELEVGEKLTKQDYDKIRPALAEKVTGTRLAKKTSRVPAI